MKYSTPGACGVSSEAIRSYLKVLEDNHLAMHDIVMSRGEDIFFTQYYPPFTPDREHRLYSVTKSLVAIAVGFAVDDGLLSLGEKLVHYFPEDAEYQSDQNFANLTLRNMLMMATAGECPYWFDARPGDRVSFYIRAHRNHSRPGGSYFEYDSTGSFVMGALVERVTGKKLVDYLTEKLFSKIGVHGPVRALTAPGGHTWSDSAFLMRPEDILLVVRFLMKGGKWNGQQLLSEAYIHDATSNLISTGDGISADAQGYGFYIWKFYGEGYFFNGMGSQYAVAVPEKDMIFVCNGDNQGKPDAGDIILKNFYHMIALSAGDPFVEDTVTLESLKAYQSGLKLFSAYGSLKSSMADRANGVTFTADASNPMGITSFTLSFAEREGILSYVNAQGRKEIPFGIGQNAFAPFPQRGYSDMIGSQPGKRLYDGAYSAAWKDPCTLWLKVQLIDDYFGNMDAFFAFLPDGKRVKLSMTKTAEDFLSEYQGTGTFTAQ